MKSNQATEQGDSIFDTHSRIPRPLCPETSQQLHVTYRIKADPSRLLFNTCSRVLKSCSDHHTPPASSPPPSFPSAPSPSR